MKRQCFLKMMVYSLVVLLCTFLTTTQANIVHVENIKNGILLTTPYGKVFVDNPLLIDLINHPALQRLKDINQYGPGHFVRGNELYRGVLDAENLSVLQRLDRINPEVTVDNITYSRFDHSICVMVLYILKGRPLYEQVGGLLHDVSHTALSHAGDVVYNGNVQTNHAYQDSILPSFIIQHDIGELLEQHNFLLKDATSFADGSTKPYLDRIDYTLVGGLLAGFVSIKEIDNCIDSLNYHKEKKIWYFESTACAKKIVEAFLQLAELNTCAPWNTIVNAYVGQAIKRAISKGFFGKDDFDYNLNDQQVWNHLTRANDKILHKLMNVVLNHRRYLGAGPTSPTLSDDEESEDPSLYTVVRPKWRDLVPTIKIVQGGRISYWPLFDVPVPSVQALAKDYHELQSSISTGVLVNFNDFEHPIAKRNPVLVGH